MNSVLLKHKQLFLYSFFQSGFQILVNKRDNTDTEQREFSTLRASKAKHIIHKKRDLDQLQH